MPAGVVSVGVMADFLSVIEQSDQAGLSVEAFSGKVVTSTRDASRAWADYAKNAKLSSDVASAAAAKVAEAADAAFGSLDASAKAQGNAAMMAARATGAAADEQAAAYAKAATAARDAQVVQKAAADAQIADAEKAALATKAMADAQAEAAAKADLLTSHLSGLGARVTSVASEITKLGTIGFAASIAGMGDLAAKYQEATESIAANSGISSKAAAKIGTAFLGTSGTSIYSGKELTEAFAGVAGQLKSTEGQALSTAQAMKVMSAASALGEATGETLGSATTALATIMQGYKLSVNQAASASDLLFNTSRSLDQPMNTVAQSMTKLHGRLGDLAPSLGDIGGLMVEIGSHGVQGTRGVSVMNTAFQTLIGSSQPVQQMLDTLGVKIFNSQGKFVGLQNVIEQLQPKFAGLTQQAQDLASKTLFGSSASQVMLSVIQRGPAAFAAYTAAAEKHGTAVKGATDQDKTFAKQFDILKATIDNTATSIGLKLMPALTTMSRDLADGVDWLTKNKGAAEALGIAIGAVVGPAVAIFTAQKLVGLTSGLRATVSGVTNLGAKLLGLSGPTASAGADIESVGSAATTASGTVATAGGDMVTTTGATATGIAAANSEAGASFGAVATEATTAGAALDSEWGAAAARVEVVDDAIIAKNEETAASFTTVLGLAARLAGVAGAAAVLIGGDSDMKKYPKHPPGAPQIDAPKTGESREAYIKGSLGLPPNYKGGPITAASYKGPNEDHKDIDSFFKWLSGAGTFGKKGFQPTPASAKTGGVGLSSSFVKASKGLSGFSSSEQTNAAAIMASLERGGLSASGAAAITGNWVQESGLNPSEHGGLLAQWGGARLTNEQSFAQSKGMAYNSIPAETQFALHELQSNPQLLAALKAGKMSPQALALGVENEYERPKGTQPGAGMSTPDTYWSANTAGREQYAAQIYTAFSGKQESGSLVGTTAVPTTGSKTLSKSVLNIGSGGTLPAVMQATTATNQATQLSDQANQAQAVGQAQVTWLQAINQQLQDVGSGKSAGKISTMLLGTPERATMLGMARGATEPNYGGLNAFGGAENASSTTLKNIEKGIGDLKNIGAAGVQDLANLQTMLNDRGAAQVTAMKDATQKTADAGTENVTAMKNQQTINDQASALTVATIKNQTTAIQDASAVQVAAINASATRISDADNAQATLITDNAQTNADTLGERGLYGLNLVTQQLTVQADIIKAGFDQQIATAQATLDSDQGLANIANATAQQTTDQVTAAQTMLELAAQQNVNMVTQTQDALEAKAQQHLDAVTMSQDAKEAKAQYHMDSVTLKEDAIANAAKAHTDAVTVSQDNRILKATQHADSVQLSVDVTKIGPAQTWADMQAGASKAAQTQAQNALNLATAQGSVTTGAANAALANVTAGANTAIAQAQNQYQTVQNAANAAIQNATDQYQQSQNNANMAIQKATDQYQSAQNTANSAIQTATDNYQTVQDQANQAIANATQTQAGIATNWAGTLAGLQKTLSGVQGAAATGEATAGAAVSTSAAEASTQFAGSGLVVNQYGVDLSNPAAVSDAASWAIRTAGLATA